MPVGLPPKTRALYFSGGPDVALLDGGTGASNARDARLNLRAAPNDAAYVLQTAHSELFDAQALDLLGGPGLVAVDAVGTLYKADATDLPPHALLSAQHSDTLLNAPLRGALIVGNATPLWSRFAAGAVGSALFMGASDPIWRAVAETDITDGTILARLAAAETISGSWVFSSGLVEITHATTPTLRLRDTGGIGYIEIVNQRGTLVAPFTQNLAQVDGTILAVGAAVAGDMPASGSLLRGAGATASLVELAIGASGTILTSSGAVPQWSTNAAVVDIARTWATLQTFKDTTFKVVDDADASKTAVFSLGGASANADLTLAWAGTADRTWTWPDVPATYAGVGDGADPPVAGAIGKVNRTAIAADPGVVNLTNATPAGYYIVDWTFVVTTLDASAGQVIFGITYTDDIGSTTQSGSLMALTGLNRTRGSFQVYLASGNITWGPLLAIGAWNAARCALRVRCTFNGS